MVLITSSPVSHISGLKNIFNLENPELDIKNAFRVMRRNVTQGEFGAMKEKQASNIHLFLLPSQLLYLIHNS